MRLSASRSPVSTPRAGPSSSAIGPCRSRLLPRPPARSRRRARRRLSSRPPGRRRRPTPSRAQRPCTSRPHRRARASTSPVPTSSVSQAVVSGSVVPSLERHLLVRADDAVYDEALVLEREVGAEMAAAALLACERAARDQPGQEMRRLGETAGRPRRARARRPPTSPRGLRRNLGDTLSDCPWDCP